MHNELISRTRNLGGKRRTHSAEFKAAVVAQCERGDDSLASIALAHQLNATMLRKWVRDQQLKRDSNDARFVPVSVSPEESNHAAQMGTVEVTLAGGRVRVYGAVDPQVLHAVLAALR
ncbi:MAG: transposase [Burkholderiaceae bacterium]